MQDTIHLPYPNSPDHLPLHHLPPALEAGVEDLLEVEVQAVVGKVAMIVLIALGQKVFDVVKELID